MNSEPCANFCVFSAVWQAEQRSRRYVINCAQSLILKSNSGLLDWLRPARLYVILMPRL